VDPAPSVAHAPAFWPFELSYCMIDDSTHPLHDAVGVTPLTPSPCTPTLHHIIHPCFDFVSISSCTISSPT